MIPKTWRAQYVWVPAVLFFFIVFNCCTSKEDKTAEHLEKARQYVEKNELKSAVIEFKNVIQLDPENDPAQYELGETYLKLRDEERSIQAFQRAISINPENMKAQIKMGQIFLIIKQIGAARKTVMKILEKIPNDVDALQILAGVQVQEENPDAAIRTLEKALKIDPNHFGSHLFMAQIFFSKGELDKAEKAFFDARSLNPASPSPYVELTRLYGSRGEWDRAEATLKAMVKTSGQKPRKWTDLAGFYESRKEWNKAEKAYEEAVAVAPADDVDPLMNLGSFYARRKVYDKALVVMKRAADIKKDDPSVLIQIARLHFSFTKFPEAEAVVDGILGRYSEQPQANFLKGRLHLLRKEYIPAFERFDLAIKESPKDAQAHYFRAMCILNGGIREGISSQDLIKAAAGHSEDTESWEREMAAQSLVESLELDPKFLPARLLYIDICLQARNARLARKHLDIALKAIPMNPRVQTQMGKLRFLEGDFHGAEKDFKKIIEQNPDYPQGHISLGLLYAYLNRDEDAIRALNEALNLNPGQLDPLDLIVAIRMRNKDYDKALKICEEQRRKLASAPDSLARIEYLIGEVYRAKGDMKIAQKKYRAAIDRDPLFLPPHMALAGTYMAQEKKDLAISRYETILKKNPRYVPACMALGMVYEGMAQMETAEKYYRKALEIKRDYVPAANNLAFILADRGLKLSEAAELAELAKSQRPKDPIVLDTLGWVYYKQGRYAAAIDELEASLAVNPKDASTNYHLGWAYYELGKFDKARGYMRKALELDQNFKGADQARSILGE